MSEGYCDIDQVAADANKIFQTLKQAPIEVAFESISYSLQVILAIIDMTREFRADVQSIGPAVDVADRLLARLLKEGIRIDRTLQIRLRTTIDRVVNTALESSNASVYLNAFENYKSQEYNKNRDSADKTMAQTGVENEKNAEKSSEQDGFWVDKIADEAEFGNDEPDSLVPSSSAAAAGATGAEQLFWRTRRILDSRFP